MEVAYERASHEARDGYLSRVAAVLKMTPLAIADEATWRGSVATRCPARATLRRWVGVDRDVPVLRLETGQLKKAARALKRYPIFIKHFCNLAY